MIGKLKGIIDEIGDNCIILDVACVGYVVFVSEFTKSKLLLHKEIVLFVETHVREARIHLFGFLSYDEKKAFITLQNVTGIGTKMAMHILSYATPQQIQFAINAHDKGIFENISGIGGKLAARILRELKNKTICATWQDKRITQENNVSEDAIMALVGLGLSKQDASSKVYSALGINSSISVDELIRQVLKK